MTPLEKMARAIAVQRNQFGADDEVGKSIAEHSWRGHVDDAKAALQALREPSEGMFEAADRLPIYDGEGHNLRDVWQAMITAAIDEQAG